MSGEIVLSDTLVRVPEPVNDTIVRGLNPDGR
jgi:hypothetical protein